MSCCSDKMRMLAILLLLLLSTLCKATITITETGEHFASRPDHLVGIRFLQGVEYMARLQVFADNRHLCPDPSHPHLNLTVQVPFDGLPGTSINHCCLTCLRYHMILTTSFSIIIFQSPFWPGTVSVPSKPRLDSRPFR
jgi:hypothetical protein